MVNYSQGFNAVESQSKRSKSLVLIYQLGHKTILFKRARDRLHEVREFTIDTNINEIKCWRIQRCVTEKHSAAVYLHKQYDRVKAAVR